jgi:hypothetical protein
MQLNLTMTPLIATFLRGTVGPATVYTFVVVMLTTGVAVFVAIGWVVVKWWIERTRCRNWPTVTAVVDIVSVAFIKDDPPSRNDSYYQATLTYTYNNPEQQMGDYSRDFGNEDDAKAWANSYKGETVKVHVDPRDATRSILQEEDL